MECERNVFLDMKTSVPPGTSTVQTFQRLTKKQFITSNELIKPKHCHVEMTLAACKRAQSNYFESDAQKPKSSSDYAIKNNLNKTLCCIC